MKIKEYEKDKKNKSNWSICNNYLNELTENRASWSMPVNILNRIEIPIWQTTAASTKPNLNRPSSIRIKKDELFENQFKCKSLIKFEEKEYFEQIITTTTTVRTLTTDDLFYLFDSTFYQNHSHSSNFLNKVNNPNERKPNKLQHNLNPSVYSCLTHYFSDVKNP